MDAGAFVRWAGQTGPALAELSFRDPGVPLAQVVDVFAAVHVLEQQLAAVKLRVLLTLADRDVAKSSGASSLVSWLSGTFRIGEPAAKRLIDLAKFVDVYQPVADGLRDGSVNVEQAQVIASAVKAMPCPKAQSSLEQSAVAEEHRRQAAAILAGPFGAPRLSVKELRAAGDAILHHVAADVAERSEREALERSEREAHQRRGFTMSPQAIGGVRFSGWLTDESAAIVREAIEPLCAPRNQTASRATGARSGQPADAPGDRDRDRLSGDDARLSGGLSDELVDERTAEQKRADALVEVCRMILKAGDLPEHGGELPQVNVTVPFDIAAGRLGAGMLDTGVQVTPATVRRMACDANIIPIVLGSAGQVLDVGRSQRLFTGPLRRALNVRDGGCAFPGCDRRPKWCEGHHILHWADGGPTNLHNSVLLCAHHHRLIHHSKWVVRMGGDGLPEFIPPAWVDQSGAPRRNHRITLRHLRAGRQDSRLAAGRQGAGRGRGGDERVGERRPAYHLQT